jgi:hypothetical protein
MMRSGTYLWGLRRPVVAIVMGLDQHRAQITAEWIDTDTGEVSRAGLSPALRADWPTPKPSRAP